MGVLPDKDILSDIDGNISFAYLDSKTNTRKTRTLPAIKAEPRKKAKLICPCCKKPMQFMGIRARTIHFNSASPIGSS
ncbi:hypothetical protein PLUTE_a4103 [Pseudoalteromonas luteoviolacea DSM 6061]|nr:hypothetical protein [Pseudoalteromonas luteoviolacea DSM 6061]